MKHKLQDSDTHFLYQAILSLKDESECDRFFEDICTISEIKSLAQRLQVARMLRHKKNTPKFVMRPVSVPRRSAGSTAAWNMAPMATSWSWTGLKQTLK